MLDKFSTWLMKDNLLTNNFTTYTLYFLEDKETQTKVRNCMLAKLPSYDANPKILRFFFWSKEYNSWLSRILIILNYIISKLKSER